MRFRAEQHLRRQRDFRMAREQGRRIECGGFTLWYVKRDGATTACSEVPAAPASDSGLETATPVDLVAKAPSPSSLESSLVTRNASAPLGPRVGVVASTAAVGGAVQRNRAKRRLREVFRHHQQQVPSELDLLLIARRSLNQLAYPEIEKKFLEACVRLQPKPEAAK